MGTLNGHQRLTDLEASVIAAIAGGASDREAAARLRIYEDTVRLRLRSAMRRWAASDRRQLLVLWRAAQPGTHTT